MVVSRREDVYHVRTFSGELFEVTSSAVSTHEAQARTLVIKILVKRYPKVHQ